MYQPIQLTIAIPPVRNSINRSPLRRGFLFIPFAIALTWLAPLTKAQTCPSRCDSLGNTSEGNNIGSNQIGQGNTAIGDSALQNNIGDDNTATGYSALLSNTSGFSNTANGKAALYSNTTGGDNTATGLGALASNTTGDSNTATGFFGLASNTTRGNNTATGLKALATNTNGAGNTATGVQALSSNTTAFNNTADGQGALRSNTTGGSNIALGFSAGGNLTTGNRNIDIGNVGSAGESNTIRIGTKGTQTHTFIAGIYGTTIASAVGVVIDVNGHLGTTTSSERFKDQIKPMDKASEAILTLKPVTFRYKHELDPEGIPQFGLVAEQVEKVNPDLVARDADGKVNTVRYEAVNAMLLNEFLKEHCKVQEHQATITRLESKVAKQEAVAERQQKDFQATAARQQEQIEALTAGLQKVSAQVEMNRPASQMVAENQ